MSAPVRLIYVTRPGCSRDRIPVFVRVCPRKVRVALRMVARNIPRHAVSRALSITPERLAREIDRPLTSIWRSAA